MRYLMAIVSGAVVFCLGGFAYLRHMDTDNHGTTISQSITLARVRRNMVRIADAEREQFTAYSECLPVDELISRGKVDEEDRERGGYSFSIACTGGLNFSVTGRRAPEPPDSTLHWPLLEIDQSLEFHESY
jgi:hypothetical protein